MCRPPRCTSARGIASPKITMCVDVFSDRVVNISITLWTSLGLAAGLGIVTAVLNHDAIA